MLSLPSSAAMLDSSDHFHVVRLVRLRPPCVRPITLALPVSRGQRSNSCKTLAA